MYLVGGPQPTRHLGDGAVIHSFSHIAGAHIGKGGARADIGIGVFLIDMVTRHLTSPVYC